MSLDPPSSPAVWRGWPLTLARAAWVFIAGVSVTLLILHIPISVLGHRRPDRVAQSRRSHGLADRSPIHGLVRSRENRLEGWLGQSGRGVGAALAGAQPQGAHDLVHNLIRSWRQVHG